MKPVKMKRFIECTVRNNACNMECEYCYITQGKERVVNPVDFSLCLDRIGKALSVERLGGICMVNICATGETLIPKDMIAVVKKILENGHYVMIVTNGTLTKRFAECCDFPEDYRKRLFFKISFHYLELKKQNKMDVFFKNIHMVWKAGISFTLEITPDDSYIPYISEMKKVCMEELGSLPHITIPRDERYKEYPCLSKLPFDKFIKTWQEFDSELFRVKASIWGVKREEFCYAGEWAIVLNLLTGDYRQCYHGKRLGNLYRHVNEPLRFCPVGHNCPEGHCFNGHTWLGFGVIPEIEVSAYADQRNRIREDGAQWLSEPMEQFMRCRLRDMNEEYSLHQKKIADIKSFNSKQRVKKLLRIK